MARYLLLDKAAWGETALVQCKKVTLDEAAREMGLEASHIEWAIEEYGRCDEGQRIVIKEDYNPDIG